MCAAKLERTGFVLRNVWPNVKQQSANIAHEQSGTFVRKSSGGKNEAGPGAAARVAAAAQAAPSHSAHPTPPQQARGSIFPGRGNALRQQRARLGPGPRHVASDFLRAQAGFKHSKAFSSVAVAVPTPEPSFEPFAPVARPRDDRSRSGGISIDELMKVASEKYKLNSDFWGKHTDIPSMAQATDKEDILQIIENFVLIHRKHVYLFQQLKNTVMKNLPLWSAPDLALLCHSWAQIGFLHEDLCVAMSSRVTATAHLCNAQELCWLMDAYATARCSVRSVTEEITAKTLVTLDNFTLQQLCLHASSFARLNIHHEELFRAMAASIVQRSQESVLAGEAMQEQCFSARDLTLAAYSFAKLGFFFPQVFGAISLHAQEVIRDFTARDLQMLIVAFARAQYRNSELLGAVSLQAQRRIAQFSAESLTLTLRSLAFFDMGESGLFTRAIAQLPRSILTFRPADVTTFLGAFAAAQVHSESLFDVVTPYILEKASMFSPTDWISALGSYSALGHRDPTFLYAMKVHLEASRLSLQQLSSAMVDCSRLSFVGHSESLAQAATAKLQDEAEGGAGACPPEVVAQMYASLLLLGHSSPHLSIPAPPGLDAPPAPPPGLDAPPDLASGGAVPGLLSDLAQRLRSPGSCETLSPATRVSLCYATLLAPPVRGSDRHPVSTDALVDRCLAEVGTLTAEERLLLRQVLHALELLPWNRRTFKHMDSSLALADINLEAERSRPQATFFHTAWNHLAPAVPHVCEVPPTVAVHGESAGGCEEWRGPRWRGVFLAREIQKGLEEMSVALAAAGIENQLVADNEMEAHIILPEGAAGCTVKTGDRQIALIWGSSVHYSSAARELGAEEPQPRLSLSAKFQVALLQAVRELEVVVVPHWWWRSSDDAEISGQRLLALLANGGRLPAAPLAPPRDAVAGPSTSCIE